MLTRESHDSLPLPGELRFKHFFSMRAILQRVTEASVAGTRVILSVIANWRAANCVAAAAARAHFRRSSLVDGEVVSSIGRGVMVLVGICNDDKLDDDAEFIVRKILNMRVFEDEDGAPWKKSVKDLDLEILSVSQFTLYGSCAKNKPDYHRSMSAEQSREFYDKFLEKLRAAYKVEKVQDGKFQAMMKVSLVNDGPVTLTFDSAIRK